MKSRIQLIGEDELTKRGLFFLSLDSPDEIPGELKLSSEHFACLVAWDSKYATKEKISNLVETIIKSGAAYICCWGSGCGRVEGIADEIQSDPENSFSTPVGSVIMTTSHETESLEEVMWYFLNVTSPDTYYEKTMNSNLVISINNNTWDETILKILKDPDSIRDK